MMTDKRSTSAKLFTKLVGLLITGTLITLRVARRLGIEILRRV